MICNKYIIALISIYFCMTVIECHDKGFIIYCPCMGRFGNQAEQLLGSLLFAKHLNRTLVLPPFIHYGLNYSPMLIPFESIIQVEPIKNYHDVILMTEFMRLHAPSIWPAGQRKFYCYSTRYANSDNQSCDALRGQPFNTFWNHFNISEDQSQLYKPLVTNANHASYWEDKFPISNHPVLTFVGAPSPFPTTEDSVLIQKHMIFSDEVAKNALKFRQDNRFHDRPYLSIHIRHGSDWEKACELLQNGEGLTQLFSSSQCTGYHNREIIDYGTCFPSFDIISQRISDIIKISKTKHYLSIHNVHIATDIDNQDLWFNLSLKFPDLKFFKVPRDLSSMKSTTIDLYLMSHADIFIGNCISSFSAFPARIRTEQLGLKEKTFYFGQDFEQVSHNDEL